MKRVSVLAVIVLALFSCVIVEAASFFYCRLTLTGRQPKYAI